MRRTFPLLIIIAAALLPALTGEPGEPLDWIDCLIPEHGSGCEAFRALGMPNRSLIGPGEKFATKDAGDVVNVFPIPGGMQGMPRSLVRFQMG